MYDFFIPVKYRGRKVELPPHPRGLMPGEARDPKIILDIPREAHFLDVQPFYDEDNESGKQDLTTRQRLGYYSEKCECISEQWLEEIESTDLLMGRLEGILKKQY